MNLAQLLEQKKTAIIDAWFNEVMQSYPPDTAPFFKQQKDPFKNPVGATMQRSLTDLFDGLLKGLDEEGLSPLLDPVIRIRAVQNFTPSQAVAFLLGLKRVIRSKIHKEMENPAVLSQLLTFELSVDQLGLLGFDIYSRCREQLADLRVSTEREKTYRAFARAGLIQEASESGPDSGVS